MADKTRYSDEELEEFRVIIREKLELAYRDYNEMMRQLMNADGNDVEDTSPAYNVLEEGSEGTSSQEALYRYFSKRKVSLHPPQPEVVLSAGVKDKSVPEEKGGLFGWLRKFRKT